MKDMVNFSGMIAADILQGDMPASHWSKVQEDFLLNLTPVASRHIAL